MKLLVIFITIVILLKRVYLQKIVLYLVHVNLLVRLLVTYMLVVLFQDLLLDLEQEALKLLNSLVRLHLPLHGVQR